MLKALFQKYTEWWDIVSPLHYDGNKTRMLPINTYIQKHNKINEQIQNYKQKLEMKK